MARPTKQKQYLIDKYHEIAWALSMQDFSSADIAVILNRHRSVIGRIIAKRPKGYRPKWVKAAE